MVPEANRLVSGHNGAMSTSTSGTVGVGVVGLGFMGQTHLAAIGAAQAAGVPCRLVAVCDEDPKRLTGKPVRHGNTAVAAEPERRLFDPEAVSTYTETKKFFADPAVDLVHICTWTDTHVDLAIEALSAGKHVLIEKPVAHTSEEVARLARVSNTVDRLCMPAMVMRYWPEWVWLRDRIRDKRLGVLKSLVLTRLGSTPTWTNFYKDEERSGGALLDLHVHDADFILWCFGAPETVCSSGTQLHLTSLYRFPPSATAPRHVVAEGGWGLDPAAGFRMRYLACFEKATAEFDLARTPRLLLHRTDGGDSPSSPVDLPNHSGYEAEVAAAIEAVSTGNRDGLPTVEEAIVVTRLLEAEYRSIHSAAAERVMCRWR